MLWYINDEEYVFDSWEELGTALRDLCRNCSDVQIDVGPQCVDCNGKGHIIAFTANGTNVHMECAECNATGIKH